MSSSIYTTVQDDPFPQDMEIAFGSGAERQVLLFEKVTWEVDGERQGLRYGENPDQPAALYRPITGNISLGGVQQISPGQFLASDALLLQSGKHPGKINITDTDAALNILRYFPEKPACVIVKHNNPSGVALGSSPVDAYRRALEADQIAAFGGVIALNREVDQTTAEAINEQYAEVVVAPGYTGAALSIFEKKKNLRVLLISRMDVLEQFQQTRFLEFKSLIDGGVVVQWSYQPRLLPPEELTPAETTYRGTTYRINRSATDQEKRDMRFGWLVESGVTSNSVLFVKDEQTVAIGTGEQDRVGVARIARNKAYWKRADQIARATVGKGIEELPTPEEQQPFLDQATAEHGGLGGSVMVSDAFFPFRDGADIGLREGIAAILQPGGSVRDFEVIQACNEYNVTMAFTGQRSFRH